MGTCRARVTKKSDCFKWLKELISCGITEFKFNKLPSNLKNSSMLHRAEASRLITKTKIDNNAVKTWKLNMHEIMKIDEEM